MRSETPKVVSQVGIGDAGTIRAACAGYLEHPLAKSAGCLSGIPLL